MSKREQDSTNVSQLQREQREQVNKALDEIRDNIKKTVTKAKKDISEYSQQVTSLQERALETTGDVAESYIESQREIINSFNQAIWTPYVENVVNRTTAYPRMYPLPNAYPLYTNTITSLVENFGSAMQLVNRTIFANAELISTSLLQARDNAKEYSRIGVTAAKNFHETASEVAQIGFSAVEPAVSTRRQ